MKKKLVVLFALVLLVCAAIFVVPGQLSAKSHCAAAYLACIDAAGDDTGSLDDCLRGWAACEGIPLNY